MTGIYERLTSEIEQRCSGAYIEESMLESLGIQPMDLQDISIEKWIHKNLTRLPEAALHRAGYTPQQVTLAAEEFGHYVWTADEELRLSEKDWLFAEKHGLATMGIEKIAGMVGKTASRFLMTGRNGNLTSGLGAAVEANTNFLLDEGSGAGTLERPITVTAATTGAWSTWANMQSDVLKLIANFENKNYNLNTSVVLYPKCASLSMRRGGASTREASALELLAGSGIRGVMSVPDTYMVTDGNALPVIGAFDLVIMDLSKIWVGYTRRHRTRTIPPHDEERATVVQDEVWFTPYCEPQIIDVSGTDTTYKGVGKVTAINGT